LITNTGRTILAKYLIGQAPAYASHIALGVGAKPLDDLDPFGDYSTKRNLDFEVLRIPISSRGYVYDEAGFANIVFAGELPGDQRYLFSEIGIFSGKSNPAAGAEDSKMLYTFSASENWEYHNRTNATSIVTRTDPLNGELEGSIIDPLDGDSLPIPVFRTNSNNVIFNSDPRINRYELPRFLDRALLISGDMSYIEEYDGILSIKESTISEYYGTHLHLTGIRNNFNRNSSSDQLRLAFSILDKDSSQSVTSAGRVGGVRIILEFASSDALDPQNFARLEVDLDPSDVDFVTNRYIVVTKTLGELVKSNTFTWNTINVIKIYAMVYDATGSGLPSNQFYIALDGLRLENVTAQNPLYGMTGYTVIKTENGQAITKEANTSNIVEFRYGLDVA
jgi:hypothetical protein